MAIREGFIKLRQINSNKEITITVTQESAVTVNPDPVGPDPIEPDPVVSSMTLNISNIADTIYALVKGAINNTADKETVPTYMLSNGDNEISIPVKCATGYPATIVDATTNDYVKIFAYNPEGVIKWEEVGGFVVKAETVVNVDLSNNAPIA